MISMMKEKWITKVLIGIILICDLIPNSLTNQIIERKSRSSLTIGPCTWVLDRKCPDNDVKFYLFTRNNMSKRQLIHIDESLEESNITASNFNPFHPTKIIIHGYNADMFLRPLISMKDEYLQKTDMNLIFVDWSNLSPGPCYLSAVHNIRHTGHCIGQLIERILDLGSTNIHLIGFSLGAHIPNYVAQSVGSFILPRITGLDPAMPLFVTASKDHKLDASDAAFVDVIHTNAFVQGKIERCGHVDFYMNGGIMQPGCNNNGAGNIFACSHQRAPDYFAESIRSYKGFWGWSCSSYISYLLGLCPQTNYLVIAGEDCNINTINGMYLVTTNDKSPFALGKWSSAEKIIKKSNYQPNLADLSELSAPYHKHKPLVEHIDQWGKLDSSFNNIDIFPTQLPMEPNSNLNWPYFQSPYGTNEITKILKQTEPISSSPTATTTTTTSITNIKNSRIQPLKYHKNPNVLNEAGNEKLNLQQNHNFNASEILKRQTFLELYKKNLTFGIINSNIFQLPQIQEH